MTRDIPIESLPDIVNSALPFDAELTAINRPLESRSSVIVKVDTSELQNEIADQLSTSTDILTNPLIFHFRYLELYSTAEQTRRQLRNFVIDLVIDSDDSVPKDKIMSEAIEEGWDSDEVNDAIVDLLMAGKLYEPDEGRVKPL